MEDIKELEEFIGSEDGKSAVSEWLKEAGYKSADDIAGLERKKNELLIKEAKSQKAKATLTAVYEKYGIVDIDDLGEKLATLEGTKEKISDFDKLQRKIEQIEKAAKDAGDRADREKALRANSEKSAQITSAMKSVHINDMSFDVLMPYFNNMVKIEESDNGKINLIVESDDGSSPFSEFIETWSKTDKAKTFITAPSHSGGGANGPGSGATGTQKTMEEIAAMPNQQDRLREMAKLGQSG